MDGTIDKGAKWRDTLCAIIIILVAFLISKDIFKPGYLLYLDHPVHLAEFYYLYYHLLPLSGWFIGWCDWDFAGFPFQMYFYQATFWLGCLIKLLSPFNFEFIYKLVVLLSYAMSGVGLYYLSRCFAGWFPSLITSLVFITRTEVIWEVFKGTYNTFFALGIIFLAMRFIILRADRLNAKVIIVSGLLGALAILSHLFMSALWFIFIAVLLFVERIRLRTSQRLVKLAIMASLSLCLCAFYLLPILATASWMPQAEPGKPLPIAHGLFFEFPLSILGIPKFVILQGIDLLGQGNPSELFKILYKGLSPLSHVIVIDLLALLGFAAITFSGARLGFGLRSLLLLGAISIIITSGYWVSSELLRALPLLGLLQGFFSRRFLIVIQAIIHLLAALQLHWMIMSIKNINLRTTKARVILLAAIALVAALGINFLATYRNPARMPGMMRVSSQVPQVKDLESLWDYIKKNLDHSHGRILYQTTYGNMEGALSNSHIMALSSQRSAVSSIGGWCKIFLYPINDITRTNHGSLFGNKLWKISDIEIARYCSKFNIGYIVTCDQVKRGLFKKKQGPRLWEPKRTLHKILENSEYFEMNHCEGSFCLFKLTRFIPALISADDPDVSIKILLSKTDLIQFQLADQANRHNRIAIKMAYHPLWRLKFNGKSIPLAPDENWLMKAEMPGNGMGRLSFKAKSVPGILITSFTLLFCGFFLLGRSDFLLKKLHIPIAFQSQL